MFGGGKGDGGPKGPPLVDAGRPEAPLRPAKQPRPMVGAVFNKI